MLLALVRRCGRGEVGVCLSMRFPWLRTRTLRKRCAHSAGLCLLVRARTQQRCVPSKHSSRAVAVLLAVAIPAIACVGAALLTVWLNPSATLRLEQQL